MKAVQRGLYPRGLQFLCPECPRAEAAECWFLQHVLVSKGAVPWAPEAAFFLSPSSSFPLGRAKKLQGSSSRAKGSRKGSVLVSQVLEAGSWQGVLLQPQHVGHGCARCLGGVQAPNGTAAVPASCLERYLPGAGVLPAGLGPVGMHQPRVQGRGALRQDF